MAPGTRSGGAPPPSRVYHSTPILQQAQFPSRRRVVRTYGKQSRDSTPGRDPGQRTLTQIDFVSSSSLSEAATVVLSDSEEDEFAAGDKENEEPASSGKRKRSVNAAKGGRKRRRTLGDGTETGGGKTKKKDESRRKTLGDVPSSKYHTQTLTQLLGREELDLIEDSEDEDDDWLQGPESPSPRAKQLPHDDRSPSKPSRSATNDTKQETSRQLSVVPQTPAKRTIRFEIPSSSQQSTPMTARMLDRYGPPGQGPSPTVKGGKQTPEQITELPGEPRKLVIEDSFATDSWESAPPVKGTPLKDITEEVTGVGSLRRESSSVTEIMSTPTKPKRRGESAELGEKTPTRPSPRKSPKKTPTPKVSIGGLYEIPDSDEDDGDFTEEEHEVEGPEEARDDKADQENAESTRPNEDKTPSQPEQDANTRNEGFGGGDDGYVAGPETQFVMDDELASSVDHLSSQPTQSSIRPPASSVAQQPSKLQQHPSVSSTSTAHPILPEQLPPPKPSPQLPAHDPIPPKPSKPLRRPLRHLPSSQTQPLESQRVPLAIIQSFGHPTNRTDIFLPLPPSTINPLASGHEIDIVLPSKIPAQVARFWLFDGSLLRYAACVEPSQRDRTRDTCLLRYRVTQLYKLNNPLDMSDMKEEGWLDDNDLTQPYVYLPPVGVSQLLANLRHALFGDDAYETEEEEESQQGLPSASHTEPHNRSTPNPGSSFSISQQVEAQLRSDIAHHTQAHQSDQTLPADDDILVPSTPLTTNTAKPPVRPSQATTASQPCTPEKPPKGTTFRRPAPPPQSSNTLTFQDHGSSSPPFLLPCSNPGASLRSSQLLTKSQMLPDSLLRDDARMPPEIWDSDGEQG